MDEDLFYAGVACQARAIREGTVGARELVAATLERIQRYDGRLNAFTVVLADQALAEAAARDDAPADERGPLNGVPVAIKEELDVAGCVTTFGGRANVTPASADCEVVRRLRAAGAVVVGKTTMSEFGSWPIADSVADGVVRNPWDTRRSSGGSSGGSAAAVAAGLVPVAIGGDGGGSIRIPSACCGIYGLKPQRGRVSTAPQPHLWWALGTTGPLTRSVADSALVYDVVRGNPPGDRFTAPEPARSFQESAATPPGPLRIAWSTRSVVRGVRPDREHVRAVEHTAAVLDALGHHVEEVDPRYPDPTPAFLPQFFAGVRSEAELVERFDLLEHRTRETVRLGSWVRPRVREWAIRRGEQVAAAANRVFAQHDLLLTPTLAHRPPVAGAFDGTGTVRAMLRALPLVAYAALWNVAGNPAASVPAGVGRDGLPLAVQLVGRPHDEGTVLAVSAHFEQARPWADRRPVL